MVRLRVSGGKRAPAPSERVSEASASIRLPLLVTPAHECGYLSERIASTAYVGPSIAKSPRLLGILTQHGFRRSGEHIYRPVCRECQACVALRVPVHEFRPRRIQRRIWRRNQDLRVVARDDRYRSDHYQLYRRYMSARHRGGSMDGATPEEYRSFFRGAWAETLFVEFHHGAQLIAVAVSDRLPDAHSAVYTFYDPDFESRSLGTYCILWQIEAARRAGHEWLYLGYWIAECDKMRYKERFLPQERLIGGDWIRCESLLEQWYPR